MCSALMCSVLVDWAQKNKPLTYFHNKLHNIFPKMTDGIVLGLTGEKRLLYLDYTLVTLILLVPFYWRDRSHLCVFHMMSY